MRIVAICFGAKANRVYDRCKYDICIVSPYEIAQK